MRVVTLFHTQCARRCSLIVSVFVVLMTGGCFAAETPATPTPTLKMRLTECLALGAIPSSIQEISLEPSYVRTIVHDNLNESLLASVKNFSGTDIGFVLTGSQTEAQIALLILEYPDSETAARMSSQLSDRNGYFKNTKILTHFSYTTIGNQLAIVFTESAGNEAVIKIVDECPKTFK